MKKDVIQNQTRDRRKKRARAKLHGTQERPRISVYKTNKHIYIQCINDDTRMTIANAHSATAKKDEIQNLAKSIATSLKEQKITAGVFDRGAYRYHGIVRSIAEQIRKNGITI